MEIESTKQTVPKQQPRYEFISIKMADGNKPENPQKIYCIPTDVGYGLSLSYWEIAARICYRLIEIPIALAALIVSLPVMLVIALIIKLNSPGPALFFQKRVARSKAVNVEDIVGDPAREIVDTKFSYKRKYWLPKTFWFVKFRTMYDNAS